MFAAQGANIDRAKSQYTSPGFKKNLQNSSICWAFVKCSVQIQNIYIFFLHFFCSLMCAVIFSPQKKIFLFQLNMLIAPKTPCVYSWLTAGWRLLHTPSHPYSLSGKKLKIHLFMQMYLQLNKYLALSYSVTTHLAGSLLLGHLGQLPAWRRQIHTRAYWPHPLYPPHIQVVLLQALFCITTYSCILNSFKPAFVPVSVLSSALLLAMCTCS